MHRYVRFLQGFVSRALRARSGKRGNSRVPDTAPPQVDPTDPSVAQLAHDLRNQMTVMHLCANGVFHSVPRGLADQQIDELRQSVDRAALLIRELLARAETREVLRSPVDVNQAIAPVVTMLSRLAGDTIRLGVNLSSVRIAVVALPLELERILLNLVLNAREAMPDGGLLSIETSLVVVSQDRPFGGLRPGRYAELMVTDTGHGMTPEIQAHIFEPFFSTQKTCTGLGLNSVAFTVRQLQGVMSVDSQPGRGTSVTVMLPLATPVDPRD